MLTYRVRHMLSRRLVILNPSQLQHTGEHCSSGSSENLDQVRTLLQLCVDRYYISPGQNNTDLFQSGMSCNYGPLGLELRKNLLDQWWHSVTGSSAQVFGINTLSNSKDPATGETGHLRIVDVQDIKRILEERQLSKEKLIEKVQELLQRSSSVRTNLFQGKMLHVQRFDTLRPHVYWTEVSQ